NARVLNSLHFLNAASAGFLRTPAASRPPRYATTRGPCSTTSGTGTSSTRSGTPNWRPTASRTFGGIDDDGGRQVLAATYSSPHGAAPPSRHTVRSRPRRRGRRRSFYRPLDHFGRASSLRCKRGLDVLDHGFKLLVRQVFERIALLDLVLARDKQGETSQVHPRLLAAHLCDGFFSVLTEIA